jgi:hypothetical protein
MAIARTTAPVDVSTVTNTGSFNVGAATAAATITDAVVTAEAGTPGGNGASAHIITAAIFTPPKPAAQDWSAVQL